MQIKEIVKKIKFKLNGGVVHLRPSGNAKGAVLISYFTYPFLTDKILTGHTNYWEAVHIAEAFAKRGYAVDVIDTTNTTFIPKKKYKFCIDTHGGNLERLTPMLGKHCIKIFYAISSHWLFHNEASWRRSFNLLKRRGHALAPERLLPSSHSLEIADRLLLLGNDVTASTYAYAKKPEFRISISAVHLYPSPADRNFEENRKNFIWLGGAGAVHKGADIVLEAFSELPELTVSLCGKYLYPTFEEVYEQELYKKPNIHSLGLIDMGSEQFKIIRNKTAFLIFPSCAEGQAGSVVAALHAGIIPIVTKECGVDVEEFGFILKDESIDEIKRVVQYAASLPTEELKRRACKAWEYARTHHTREKFTTRFDEFIDELETTATNNNKVKL